jgi:hypothetical protein
VNAITVTWHPVGHPNAGQPDRVLNDTTQQFNRDIEHQRLPPRRLSSERTKKISIQEDRSCLKEQKRFQSKTYIRTFDSSKGHSLTSFISSIYPKSKKSYPVAHKKYLLIQKQQLLKWRKCVPFSMVFTKLTSLGDRQSTNTLFQHSQLLLNNPSDFIKNIKVLHKVIEGRGEPTMFDDVHLPTDISWKERMSNFFANDINTNKDVAKFLLPTIAQESGLDFDIPGVSAHLKNMIGVKKPTRVKEQRTEINRKAMTMIVNDLIKNDINDP